METSLGWIDTRKCIYHSRGELKVSLKPVDVNTTASLGKSDAGEYQVSKSREERGGKIEVVFFVLCADKGRSFL